jgi:hypothetical protein
MALGTHWEWRGFGAATAELALKFARMSPHFARHQVTDTYLFRPGIDLNVKLRKGAEGGLKIKRFFGADGDFECWQEASEDIYALPLESEACARLESLFRSKGISLRMTPETAASADVFIDSLRRAGCIPVSVSKTRESRLLETGQGDVIVDWAAVHRPQALISIGLENANPGGVVSVSSKDGLRQVKAAFDLLEIRSEPLRTLNYLDAVEVWAGGGRISVAVDSGP